MRKSAQLPAEATPAGRGVLRVLLLGVYMADRENTVAHLVDRIQSSAGLEVEQRWVALKGQPGSEAVRAVTKIVATAPEPKFSLVNRLLQPDDIEKFDFIIALDDDIYVPEGFLPAFLAHQRQLGFSVAQPARALHSHFDHAFVLQRPWLRARQTLFVECGPLVCFSREAARLLLPFDQDNKLWGIDLVWAEVIRQNGLSMGIVDAVAVDHSLRPQAQTYSKPEELATMNAYLATRPHIPFDQAFQVIRKYR